MYTVHNFHATPSHEKAPEGNSDTRDEPPDGKTSLLTQFLIEKGANLREIAKVKRFYPMRVTKHFLGLIKEKGDPIWKQCIPSIEELMDRNQADPLMEERDTVAPCVVHRYPDRVLLLVSSRCAMYCRFCTRKRKVGRINEIPIGEIIKGIEYIKEHDEVRDVLLSGGDPFMRSDKELECILKEVRAIPHVEIVRIGTRIPAVLPHRITKRLAGMLRKYHPLYINIHFEHPNELDEKCCEALKILADAGLPLGSQSVVLKGVNNEPRVMKELFCKLVMNRVKPYYLYMCDPSKGVDHFRTSIKEGLEIIEGIRGWTSGLCVPHFVIDAPGGGGKIPMLPAYVMSCDNYKALLRNYEGKMFTYYNPER